jgi:hypothetical protein
MKVISLPEIFQSPGDAGVIVGVYEVAASLEENRTTIDVVPDTPVAPEGGDIDTTLNGLAVSNVVDVEFCRDPDGELGLELPPSVLVTTAPTPIPTSRTATTIVAINARECPLRTRYLAMFVPPLARPTMPYRTPDLGARRPVQVICS